MNGILMPAGIDVITVPKAKVREFNENMVHFYPDHLRKHLLGTFTLAINAQMLSDKKLEPKCS
jgi:hypothetical protein